MFAPVLLLLLASCAGTPKPVLSPEEAVALRAKERWDHLIAKRSDSAWEYLSPGARSMLDRDGYVTGMRTRPVRWIEAEVVGIRCEGDSCEADVLVRTEAPLPFSGTVPGQTVLSERWISLGGTWYYVPSTLR
ncbi:MAG TPA: hypothetical protein PKZ76_08220 [Xanthomonadaceae bacterium]|nr:hypothetical protein [Xanthomonadaceae bacterium]